MYPVNFTENMSVNLGYIFVCSDKKSVILSILQVSGTFFHLKLDVIIHLTAVSGLESCSH